MRASFIAATGLIIGAVSLIQPAIAAVGSGTSISPSTDLITVVKAKRSKKSTNSTAPDASGGTAATGSNATPGGK